MSAPPEKIGDYEIEGELGAGGMAKVYRARHPILDTHHAIKVLDPSFRENPNARQRFLDEARIQAKHLDHDNIVKVTNIIATPEHAALVMELIDGGSLESRIPTLKDRPDEIKRILLAVLDAVGHAHAAGIVHRDLKPANVLLDRDGTPKVTDFGIAKVMSPDDGTKKSTAADARMGTLSYMSPEQIRRAKDVTARSDIFSLGAMLYEMATGQIAFPGDSDYDVMDAIIKGRYVAPASRHANIDPVFAAVIAKALDPDPAQRYASCAEMAAALRDESPRALAAPVAATPVAAVAGRGHGMLIGLVGGAFVLGGGAVYLALRNPTPASGSGSGAAVATIDAAVLARDAATIVIPAACVGTWSGSAGDTLTLVIPSPTDLSLATLTWTSADGNCNAKLDAPTYADGKLSAAYTCADRPGMTGTVRFDCEGSSHFANFSGTDGPRGFTTSIAMEWTTSVAPLPPPALAPPPAPPPRTNNETAYCVTGFSAGHPSECEQKQSLHPFWHLHGYVAGEGHCFQCWDEEDDDCEDVVPKRLGFRYLGSTLGDCGGIPHASEGNVREGHSSTTIE